MNRLVFILTLLFISCQKQDQTSDTATTNPTEASQPQLFTLLSPEQTGVTFQNTLTEGLNTNILMYEYFYNGGGIAAGDFNGDKLIDLYFTSNMGDNSLYLNKGNMKFEDITGTSGAAGRSGPWKTGVCTVDINNDGRLDIYLCYSGAMPPEKRTNQLFVNQGNDVHGNPVFVEKAAEYGLASQGFSNQAYFFDYDRDGDLDMALLNHNPKNLPILNEESTKEFLKTDDPDKGLRLFKQTKGHFEDVTTQTGINGSALSYGLGLGLGDFNNDGWVDFYLSNDYAVPDYLYINNRNGTFSNQLPQSIGHNSQFSMGNDVADINNDGLTDIFTLDMLPEDNHRQKLLLTPDNFAKFDLNVRSGFGYQYMRNMLQLNNGNNTFSEMGQVAGISNTDWSWAALLADFDNDGFKDLYVSNGYNRDYTNLDFIKYMDDFTQAKGRLVREDVLEIISKMPASNVSNYVFKNHEGLRFSNQTSNWGMNTPANSNGSVYADLDNDGDLDVVVNNINKPAFVYQNQAQQLVKNNFLQIQLVGNEGNTQGIGASVKVFCKEQAQSLFQSTVRGYLSAVSPVMHVGLGTHTQIDSLQVVWANGKEQWLKNLKTNQLVVLEEKNATPKANAHQAPSVLFTETPSPIAFQDIAPNTNDFDRQSLMMNQLSHTGPCMATGDVNGDGLDDVFIGGAAGQSASLFLQQKNGHFNSQRIPTFEADKNSHDAAATLFDANGDGALDLYVASGGYHTFSETDPLLQDRLYLNDGKGNFNKTTLPPVVGSKSCVRATQIAGKPTLFVGGRVVPGRYPESPNSYLLQKNGNAWQVTNLGKMGMITDAQWIDLNQDKNPELVVVGEWMAISVFKLDNNKLTDVTSQYFDRNYEGWWNTIAVGDFNNDKKPDFFVGNWGTNSQVKASVKEPVEMYFSDFDNNGSMESILCCYIQGKSYPYITRDELLNQINGFRAKYPTYESYADATLDQLFDSQALTKAGHLRATTLQTTCFLSTPSGKYQAATLPIQAQYAPIHTLTIYDANGDGNTDILLCGNNHHPKIRLGQIDANYGTLLQGNGKGGFQYIPQSRSGFQLKGDVRSVALLKDKLLFGINGQRVVAYKRVR